nr:AMIN domain-containing protein [Desulfovibrio sp. JC022]
MTVFYRRFYILLFLIWLGAVSGLFVLSVWGDFDTFIRDFSIYTRMAGNGTPAVVNGSQTFVQAAKEEVTSVRREVVHEVRKVERETEQLFEGNKTADSNASDPIKREIQQDLAANRTVPVSKEAAGGIGMLDSLEFTHTENEFLARLQTSSKVGRVTYFWLDKPSKLVVDLRGKWRYSVPRKTDFISGFVGQVVLGRHTDRLRLVFNFRDPAAEKGPSPQLIRTPQGLDIVVSKSGQ